MTRQYFGTDGVRGPYGGPVINEMFLARLGMAAVRWLRTGAQPGNLRVVIGRDTRLSGSALEAALAAGLRRDGAAPVSLGTVPAPAVARAVLTEQAALGAMITASHNPATDNGIKFFDTQGMKLSDRDEARLEQLLPADPPSSSSSSPLPTVDALGPYIAAVQSLLPAGALRGWRIALDTAHGATCATSPVVLRGLGAEVIGLGDAPDGSNINAGVGSEHPEKLARQVCAAGARLGVAHDGDGDRCVLCDEGGGVLDGDEILTILATHALARGALRQKTLVVTVQSNLGVDAAVQAAGGRVVRTPVGDRYVSERMRAEGAALGGESSGHVIYADISSAGDGLVAALKVIEVMLATGRPLSELRRVLRKFPQITADLRVREKRPLEELAGLRAAVAALEAEIGPRGRVLVRWSGTEPKLRLLVENEDAGAARTGVERLLNAARRELAGG
ncbi:MAG TPA: phosphoglucosamine mutase [Opitutaceae bacterium]|nr:phosphoglucosamine mutase [Opitutaceae bacterium]